MYSLDVHQPTNQLTYLTRHPGRGRLPLLASPPPPPPPPPPTSFPSSYSRPHTPPTPRSQRRRHHHHHAHFPSQWWWPVSQSVTLVVGTLYSRFGHFNFYFAFPGPKFLFHASGTSISILRFGDPVSIFSLLF